MKFKPKHINTFDELTSILEFISDGIYVVDDRAITIYVNQAYEQLSGTSRDKLIGRHMQSLTEDGYIDQSVSLLVLKERREISLLQKLGKTERDVIVTGNPIYDDEGHIKYVVTSVRDMTQLNELKNKLHREERLSKMQHHRYFYDLDDSDKPSILYKSNIMHEIVQKVEQIAMFPTSVLITGPSGVGKEEIANLVHYLSDRKDKPIIRINCGAIPEHLLESELFGYEVGAFTGSSKDGKIGLLELANGGTFFLDEIGEMPLSLQVKLLRVIQTKEVLRLGGTKAKKLDIRFISATNQNLNQKVKEGAFREDLYYRLKVIELNIPPLKIRREDIIPLAEHFFQKLMKKYRINKEIHPETLNALQSHDWPGNVRELRNVIEYVLVSVPNYMIKPSHLPSSIVSTQLQHTSLRDQVKHFEKIIIKQALDKYDSIRQAAKALQVHHTTIIKKMKEWENNN